MLNKSRIIILLLWVLWACTPEAPETIVPDDTPTKGEITVRGLVCDGAGEPLEGVVVSDCYKCVATNAEGLFELDTDLESAKFVFVSIPSGYTVPTKNGLPIFYKRLSEEVMVDGVYRLEFVLDKMKDNPDRYSVLMVADPQPRPRSRSVDKIAYHSLDCCNDLYRDMRETGSVIRRNRPCYAIVLGDIVHETMELFDDYISDGTSKMGFPTFNVIGNHDHDTHSLTDEEGAWAFEEKFGPTNYSFNLGKIHYVVVDNMILSLKNGTLNSDSPGLRDDIMAWVKSDLSFVDKSSTIMICMHSPMFLQTGSMKNKAALAEELSKFAKVHEWAGHNHNMVNNSETEVSNLESHLVIRATGEFWSNEYLCYGVPRGYVVVDVDGEDISWKFKPTIYQSGQPYSTTPAYDLRSWNYKNGVAIMKTTGKQLDDSYQMNVYPRGAYGDNNVYANIFMWDKKWETPVFVTSDGKEYKMTLVTGKNMRYDIAAKEIYDHYKATSSKYSISWNSDCRYSLFSVYSSAVSEPGGYVKVKDRFGNEYVQEVKW